MSKVILNKTELIQRLGNIEYKSENILEESLLRDMNFDNALLKLVNIDPEQEYNLCYDIAKRLLGEVQESVDPEEFQF